MIAKRMSLIDASGIRKIFDLAATMQDPVNLSIGLPDFDIPEDLKEVGIQAIRGGFNRYTQTQGTAELNQAFRDYLKRESGFEPESTLVCSGVSGALLLLILATVDPGDEVIIPDPYFVMYKHLVNLVGGVPVFVDTYPDFRLTAERVERVCTPRTKLLLVNSPNNPTGAVYPEADLRELADLARRRKLLVCSDEIYRSFSYDGPCPSIATWYPEATVVVDGLSKSMAMTGWRVGFAAGPRAVIDEMTKLQQYTFVCAPSFAQKTAVPALAKTNLYNDEYRLRRDLIYKGLLDAGYEVQKSGGAFYIFPRCPGDETAFIDRALAKKLLIIPGSVFSEKPGHFRISFASDRKVIERGIELLAELNASGGR